jgi:hypothetical protein
MRGALFRVYCMCVWYILDSFRSEHEVEKAQRRAQQEVNDWEAFVATAQARVARKYVGFLPVFAGFEVVLLWNLLAFFNGSPLRDVPGKSGWT